MRFKFTLLLLALNLLAAGALYYLEREPAKDGGEDGLAAKIGRRVADASRIELREADAEPRVLEQRDASWRLVEPLEWRANRFAVNRILNQLQFLEQQAVFPVEDVKQSDQTLEDYGLAEPAFTLVIGEGDEALALRFGAPTDVGKSVYLLGPEGRRIHVVSRQVLGDLMIAPEDLRAREIFDIPVFETQAIHLQAPSGEETDGGSSLKVRLVRSNGGWKFEAPLSAEADGALVSKTLNRLASTKVLRFVEPEARDPSLHGLDSPSLRVTLRGNQRSQTLLLGNKDASGEQTAYFARLKNAPTVFTVQAAPFDELRQAQESLRDRSVLSFDPDNVNAVEIEGGDRLIRLQRLETGGWQIISNGAGESIDPLRADAGRIRELLASLQTLEASDFAVDDPAPSDLARLGFDSPRRAIRLLRSGDREPIELKLAHPNDENQRLFAQANQAKTIYEVPRRPTLEFVPLNVAHYRDRTLETLPEAAVVESIRIETIDTGEDVFAASLPETADSWQKALPDRSDAVRAAVQTIVETLRSFRVEKYLQDTYPESGYALDEEKTLPWRYRLRATIMLPGGDEPQREKRIYTFTERLSSERQIGGSPRFGAVFRASQPLIDAMDLLIDPMAPPPEAKGEAPEAPDSPEPIDADANEKNGGEGGGGDG